MSLVELIVYMVIGLVVLVGVAQVLVTGWKSDASTRDRDTATGEAQVVASSIQSSVRSATDFEITGNLLRATVAKDSGGWDCRAWLLTDDGRLMYHSQDSSAGAIAVPASTPTWTTLATGVAGTLTDEAPFAQDLSSATMLRLGISVTVGSNTVPIQGGAAAQSVGTGAPSCW